jgi:flagellar M-ring protein FliF
MNTAVAELDATRPANPLVDGFSRLDNGRKLSLGLGALAMVGVLAAAFYMGNQPDYRVLYANLSDKDGGAVLAQLSQMNVPYKHADGGNAILVPANQVHETRLRLASQGLPKGGIVGFELMDANRLGMTQFQERLSFQRGLEGELVRSITALNSVADARVHLALPSQTGFFREQQKPSASVLLQLHPGRTLDRTQVAGIVHLVAASVPEMNPKAVSVVDQNGALLSQPPEAQAGSVDSQQLEYVRTLEQMYTQRILDLLEPVLGRNNVRAQVTADVDFSLVEQTSEQHRPNQGGAPSAVRSQQLVESGTNIDQTVPGAPVPWPTCRPGRQRPRQWRPGPGGHGRRWQRGWRQQRSLAPARTGHQLRSGQDRFRDAQRHRHRAPPERCGGAQPRGSHRPQRARAAASPLPPEQMEQINALVREAIGFSTTRGDSVNVMNAAFTKPAVDTTEVAWWQQPDTFDLARSLAWPVGMLMLGLLLFLGMVRPALKMMAAPPPLPNRSGATNANGSLVAGTQLDTVLDEQPQRPSLPAPVQNEPTAEMLRLEDAKRLARETRSRWRTSSKAGSTVKARRQPDP